MLVAKKEQHYIQQSPKVRQEVKPRPKSKPKANLASRIKPIILVAIGFIMAFLVVNRYAMISENHWKILELEKKLQEAIKDNEQLKLKLVSSEDLEKIEEIAKNQLHMDYPDQTQIQFVELPEDEEREVQTQVAKQKDTNIWDLILKFID